MCVLVHTHTLTYTLTHIHTFTHSLSHTHAHRLQRLEMLASKFDSKATKVEAWAVGKDEALANTEDIENSNLAEIMVSMSWAQLGWKYCLQLCWPPLAMITRCHLSRNQDTLLVQETTCLRTPH